MFSSSKIVYSLEDFAKCTTGGCCLNRLCLNLMDQCKSDADVRKLAVILTDNKKYLPSFLYLNLAGNKISHEGVSILAQALLETNTVRCLCLNLSCNNISYQGIHAIVKVLIKGNFIDAVDINITNNPIGDKGITTLTETVRALTGRVQKGLCTYKLDLHFSEFAPITCGISKTELLKDFKESLGILQKQREQMVKRQAITFLFGASQRNVNHSTVAALPLHIVQSIAKLSQ
jgi:hypothetical protein